MNKVLIIDDEDVTRNTFSEVLRSYHFSTLEACDGRSGIGVFEKEMPDAVLLDLQMPGMDGIETMQEMKKVDPDVPIIFVTGHGDIPSAVEAVKMGAYDFIVKPPDYRMLVPAIDRAVAQLRLKRENAAVGVQLLETEAANRELRIEITERKRAEGALRKSEENYRNLIETMSEGLGVQDKNGLIVFMNKRACEILGYELEELIGKPITSVYDEENQKILREQMAQRHEGKRQSYEIAWTRKDGGKIFTIIAPSPLFDERGNYEGSIAIFTDISDRKLTEEALQQYAREMKNLSSHLVNVQEAERRQVARELHDEIGQALTGLNFTLETMESLPEELIRNELKKAHAQVDELMSRVRDMSLSLRPSMLDDLGLLPALLWHFRRYTAQTNIHVTFKHSRLDGRFEPEIETAVYRVVQEALTNVARHASTDKAEVLLMLENDALEIRVQDSGKGFDPGAASARGDTSGLSGMRERAELLGGRMTIESAPGTGTSLTVRVPLRERSPQKPSEDA